MRNFWENDHLPSMARDMEQVEVDEPLDEQGLEEQLVLVYELELVLQLLLALVDGVVE